MQQSLLGDEPQHSSSTDDLTLDTLTATECRHLPPSHPLTAQLLDSPSASLRHPRTLLDYVGCIAVNAASMYGFGYLVWCHNAPAPPAELSTEPYLPVPVLNPFASQQGYGVVARGSMLIDNLITTVVLTTLLTLIQGALMQLAVSLALRLPIHPALVGPPLSYFSLHTHRSWSYRILYSLLQVALPWVVLSLVCMAVLCGAVGGGVGECAVEARTAIWLKVAWCVPYVATLYPLLAVAATSVKNVSDARLQRYINKVREKHAKGDIDMAA